MLQSARVYVLAILLGVLLLSGNSCREESTVEKVPARLQIKSALPDFPSPDVYPPNYVLYDVDFPAGLSFDLNEPAHVDEITVSFFPAAGPGWSKRASPSSGLFWLDTYQPDQDTWMQRIVIDGPRFTHPWLHEFLVREKNPRELGYINGQVHHSLQDGPSVINTVMYFYDFADAGRVSSAAELFDLPPSTAVLADFDLSEDNEKRAMYIVDHLERGRFFIMAAILDTSGDGVYDPQSDWWGWASVSVPANRGGLESPIQKLDARMRPPPVR